MTPRNPQHSRCPVPGCSPPPPCPSSAPLQGRGWRSPRGEQRGLADSGAPWLRGAGDEDDIYKDLYGEEAPEDPAPAPAPAPDPPAGGGGLRIGFGAAAGAAAGGEAKKDGLDEDSDSDLDIVLDPGNQTGAKKAGTNEDEDSDDDLDIVLDPNQAAAGRPSNANDLKYVRPGAQVPSAPSFPKGGPPEPGAGGQEPGPPPEGPPPRPQRPTIGQAYGGRPPWMPAQLPSGDAALPSQAKPGQAIRLPGQTRVAPEEYKEFLNLGHGELFEVDLDRVVNAPWREPGANPKDFFNYDMDEGTWREYCKKVMEFRDELRMRKTMPMAAPVNPEALGSRLRAGLAQQGLRARDARPDGHRPRGPLGIERKEGSNLAPLPKPQAQFMAGSYAARVSEQIAEIQRKAGQVDVDTGPGYPLFTFDWGGRGGRDGRHSSRGGRERERDRDRDRERDRYYRDRR